MLVCVAGACPGLPGPAPKPRPGRPPPVQPPLPPDEIIDILTRLDPTPPALLSPAQLRVNRASFDVKPSPYYATGPLTQAADSKGRSPPLLPADAVALTFSCAKCSQSILHTQSVQQHGQPSSVLLLLSTTEPFLLEGQGHSMDPCLSAHASLGPAGSTALPAVAATVQHNSHCTLAINSRELLVRFFYLHMELCM